jgi:hypothetical protein
MTNLHPLSLSLSLYIYGQGEHGKHLKPPNDGNCLTHILAYGCIVFK